MSISASCISSFSNTLSIKISKEYRYENKSEEEEDFIGLNYNLKTGEQIKFSDLFTNDAGIKNIISQSAYHTFATEYLYKYAQIIYSDEEISWDGDMNNIDYSEIEDRILKVLQHYNKNNNYQFCFDEREVYVIIGNEVIEIEMRNFYTQIAIYNRYAKYDEIFEEEPTKQFLVFVLKDDSGTMYRRVEKIGDNLFIDVQIVNWAEEDKKQFVKPEKYIQDVEKEIKECEDYVNSNKDSAIVFAFLEDLSYNETDKKVDNTIYKAKATMAKQYYQDTYLEKVLDWEQTEKLEPDYTGIHLVTLLNDSSENDKNLKVDMVNPGLEDNDE